MSTKRKSQKWRNFARLFGRGRRRVNKSIPSWTAWSPLIQQVGASPQETLYVIACYTSNPQVLGDVQSDVSAVAVNYLDVFHPSRQARARNRRGIAFLNRSSGGKPASQIVLAARDVNTWNRWFTGNSRQDYVADLLSGQAVEPTASDYRMKWVSRRLATVDPTHVAIDDFFWTTSPESVAEGASGSVREQEWISTPEKILDKLESTNTLRNDRITAVLFAETMAFPEGLTSRLLNALAVFIDEHRFCNDEETATAAGSAIRKYAMNMDESMFEPFARWLQPSQTESLAHEMELELTKALGWRLMYEPLTMPAEYPNLVKVLVGLCSDYLSPRLILQKNHASIVLHAIIAATVLDAVSDTGSEAQSLIGSAMEMHVQWFTELLNDRLDEAISAVAEHSPELAARIRSVTIEG